MIQMSILYITGMYRNEKNIILNFPLELPYLP